MSSPPATPSQAEALYQNQVRRHLRRNYLAHLSHGMLGATGFRLIQAPTFLPAYIMLLSNGSELLVGVALALQALGNTITPLIGANMITHRTRVLPVGFVTGSLMRLALLCLALTGFFLEGTAALIAILLSLLLFGLFSGMQGVIFNFLMSKLIPVAQRGRLSGLRQFLAGITSAVVAWIAGTYLLGETPTQTEYSWTFLLAFALTSIGLAMLLAVKEPEPPVLHSKRSLLHRLGSIPELLRRDPAFTRYFLARATASMGRMAMPFYILFAGEKIGLTGTNLGLTTFAFAITATISNLVWGSVADRTGFRLTFLIATGLWIAATLGLMYADTLTAILVIFSIIGAAVQGFQMSAVSMTLEFGEREDLPMRIAIANTGSDLAGTLGPLLGGILATSFGFPVVFWCSVAFLLFGGGAVALFVPEPRHS